jgi:hypothetical protein
LENVSKDACNERHKALENYLGNDKAKLEKHDGEIKTVQEAIVVLTALQKRHDDDIRDHETRIRGIESKPGKRWDSVTAEIIKLAVAATAGGAIAHLF